MNFMLTWTDNSLIEDARARAKNLKGEISGKIKFQVYVAREGLRNFAERAKAKGDNGFFRSHYKELEAENIQLRVEVTRMRKRDRKQVLLLRKAKDGQDKIVRRQTKSLPVSGAETEPEDMEEEERELYNLSEMVLFGINKNLTQLVGRFDLLERGSPRGALGDVCSQSARDLPRSRQARYR
jgi:hypothetical protein